MPVLIACSMLKKGKSFLSYGTFFTFAFLLKINQKNQ